jgi:hypothetical protein
MCVILVLRTFVTLHFSLTCIVKCTSSLKNTHLYLLEGYVVGVRVCICVSLPKSVGGERMCICASTIGGCSSGGESVHLCVPTKRVSGERVCNCASPLEGWVVGGVCICVSHLVRVGGGSEGMHSLHTHIHPWEGGW